MGTHIENPYSLTLDDLNKFDFRKYNNLQEVEEADRNLNQCQKFGELLQKVHALTKENKIELGLRLIHKHISIEEEGKAMIEKFSHSKDRPAFITSASFVDEKTYPASWLIEKDNKYLVFEYSTDAHVKKTLDEIVKDSSVLERIVQLIKQYNLESLIAPCIHARDALVHFNKNESLVEKTYFNPSASVVQNGKTDDSTSITTLWGGPITQACLWMVRCEREGDIHIKYKNHETRHDSL